MKIIIYPDSEAKRQAILRPEQSDAELESLVREVFTAVKQRGDSAVREYSIKFDRYAPETFEVGRAARQAGAERLPAALKDAIGIAAANIRKFHESQVETPVEVETVPGVRCWRESRPLGRVGIYVPGGSAPLFSTALMLAVPAKIAGCREVILFTPPTNSDSDNGIHPAILFAAQTAGVDRIFAVGGIQAVGAMVYGTETIPAVDKIFGPGNRYVTKAKQVAQSLGKAIDLPAGPSEVLVIADDTANPAFVAADLLAQAEHGADSQAILLATNRELIEQVSAEIERQLHSLPRKNIVRASLANAAMVLLHDIDECVALSDEYAPEHLIIACRKANGVAGRINNAGSVFVGNYSCESAGDYASGTNHTLPTNGYAKSYSGVSLDSFVKKITFQELTPEGVDNLSPAVATMAEAEQLEAHKNAIIIRTNRK